MSGDSVIDSLHTTLGKTLRANPFVVTSKKALKLKISNPCKEFPHSSPFLMSQHLVAYWMRKKKKTGKYISCLQRSYHLDMLTTGGEKMSFPLCDYLHFSCLLASCHGCLLCFPQAVLLNRKPCPVPLYLETQPGEQQPRLHLTDLFSRSLQPWWENVHQPDLWFPAEPVTQGTDPSEAEAMQTCWSGQTAQLIPDEV